MARLPEGFENGDARLNMAARRLLLDALDALAEHRDKLILVGAQAVHMHSKDAGLTGALSHRMLTSVSTPVGLPRSL